MGAYLCCRPCRDRHRDQQRSKTTGKLRAATEDLSRSIRTLNTEADRLTAEAKQANKKGLAQEARQKATRAIQMRARARAYTDMMSRSQEALESVNIAELLETTQEATAAANAFLTLVKAPSIATAIEQSSDDMTDHQDALDSAIQSAAAPLMTGSKGRLTVSDSDINQLLSDDASMSTAPGTLVEMKRMDHASHDDQADNGALWVRTLQAQHVVETV